MKFAAILSYNTGEATGAAVQADSCREAWRKLLDAFDGGENIRSIQLAQVLTPERIIK